MESVQDRSPVTAPLKRLQTFRALRHRNYVLLWLGQAISSTGQSMRVTVRGWLVYQMTNSPFWLGFVTTAVGIPMLIMPFLGGIVADRMDRRKLLVRMQWMLTTLWLLISLLIITGRIEIWHIILSGIVSGILQAFSNPASQAMVPGLVPREDLANAIALNAGLHSISSIIGPTLGGMGVVFLGRGNDDAGIGGVFVVTSLAILVASFLVMMIRWEHRPTDASRASMGSNFLEGIRFIRNDSALSGLILIGFASSLLIQPFSFFMPIFARDILHVGASGLGFLLTMRGVGSLVGALGIATFDNVRKKGRLLLINSVIQCLLLLAFSFSPWFLLSGGLMFGLGILNTVTMTQTQALLQLATPMELMGRVLSTRMVTMGFLNLGSLWMGATAQMTTTPFAVALGSMVNAAFTLGVFLVTPRLRRTEEWDPAVVSPQAVPSAEAR